jgi:hypothetical protein
MTAPFGGALVTAAINTNRLDHLDGPAITFAAITVQGAGFLISFMICSAFIYRLMTQKLPRDAQRPGVASHRLLSILRSSLTWLQVYFDRSLWFYSSWHRHARQPRRTNPTRELPWQPACCLHPQGTIYHGWPLALGPMRLVLPRLRRFPLEIHHAWP